MTRLIIAIRALAVSAAASVSALDIISKTPTDNSHIALKSEGNEMFGKALDSTPSEPHSSTTQDSHKSSSDFFDSEPKSFLSPEILNALKLGNIDPIWKRSPDPIIGASSYIYPQFGCIQHIVNSCSNQDVINIFSFPPHVFRNFFNLIACSNDSNFLRKVFNKPKLIDVVIQILDIYQEQHIDVCDLAKRRDLNEYYLYMKNAAYFISELTKESVCYANDEIYEFNSQAIIDKLEKNEIFIDYIKKNVLSWFGPCWVGGYEFVIPCMLSISSNNCSFLTMMQNAEAKFNNAHETNYDNYSDNPGCEEDADQSPSFIVYTMLHSRSINFDVKSDVSLALRCADILLQYKQQLSNGESAGDVIFYNFRYFFPQCFFQFASFIAGSDGKYLWQILPHIASIQQPKDFQQFIECVIGISILMDQETPVNKRKITSRITSMMMANANVKNGLLQLLQCIYYDCYGYDQYIYYTKIDHVARPVCYDLFVRVSYYLETVNNQGMIALFRNKLLEESQSDAFDFARLFWNGSTFVTQYFCDKLSRSFAASCNLIQILQFCTASAQSVALSGAIIREIIEPQNMKIAELPSQYAEIFPLFQEMLTKLIDEQQVHNIDKFEGVIRLILMLRIGLTKSNEQTMIQNLVKIVSNADKKDMLLQICNCYFLFDIKSTRKIQKNNVLNQLHDFITTNNHHSATPDK